MKKLIGYRLKKDILGSSKGTIFMPGNDWIEAVFEGDEYWDNRSDEEILVEWMKRDWAKFKEEKAQEMNQKNFTASYAIELIQERQFMQLARRLLETFNLDVSKIRDGE